MHYDFDMQKTSEIPTNNVISSYIKKTSEINLSYKKSPLVLTNIISVFMDTLVPESLSSRGSFKVSTNFLLLNQRTFSLTFGCAMKNFKF